MFLLTGFAGVGPVTVGEAIELAGATRHRRRVVACTRDEADQQQRSQTAAYAGQHLMPTEPRALLLIGSQNFQPSGGGGQFAGAFHPSGGVQPGGGAGQLGGEL